MYGAGAGTMFVQVRKNVPGVTMRQIEYLRECFNEMCPSILDYREELLRQVRQRGELRTLFLGRRRLFPLAGVVEPDASVIWNFPIQGTAADIISLRVLKLYPYLPDGTVLISQIHDAILLEAMADNAQAVASIVEKHLPYKVVYGGRTMPFPVEVKIGKTWADV
jgi:DNA polymerase I-like protein with 3'-5' exonuclease and polymerase domains